MSPNAMAQRRRPSDAQLEEAREAVIDATRMYVKHYPQLNPTALMETMYELDRIEAARAAYPAIAKDGVSGYDLWGHRDEIGGWTTDHSECAESSCDECSGHGLDHHRAPDAALRFERRMDIYECAACGYWYGVIR